MLHFPLCQESVMGMQRIEIEFELDMVFCFGIRLALYAVFVACFGKQDRYWIGFVSGFGFYRRQISKRSTSGYRTFRALVEYSFDLLNLP